MDNLLVTAKRVDNGEWVEGFMFYTPEITATKKSLSPCIQVINPETLDYNTYKVFMNTISRFTGKTTNNEHPMFYDTKKVFENQIVSFGNNKTKYKVVFKNYEWIGISNEGDKYGPYTFRFAYTKQPIFIHGNVFDNPELMNYGKDNL